MAQDQLIEQIAADLVTEDVTVWFEVVGNRDLQWCCLVCGSVVAEHAALRHIRWHKRHQDT